jgi:hypothetical protein
LSQRQKRTGTTRKESFWSSSPIDSERMTGPELGKNTPKCSDRFIRKHFFVWFTRTTLQPVTHFTHCPSKSFRPQPSAYSVSLLSFHLNNTITLNWIRIIARHSSLSILSRQGTDARTVGYYYLDLGRNTRQHLEYCPDSQLIG